MPTPAVPVPRLSLAQALCGKVAGCRVDSVEPLDLPTESGHPHLVRTSLTGEAAASVDWGGDDPDYWIAVLDDRGFVLRFQRLTTGFKEEEKGSSDALRPTFTLTLHRASATGSQATLRISEPSPGGTAWGRNGFVRFSWPDFRPLEWEYGAFHVINPSLNSTRRWNWETRSGSSDYTRVGFRYAIPQLALDPAFSTSAWKSADLTGCASRLHAANAEHLPGDRSSPHALTAVLSSQAELFVELQVASQSPLSKRASIEVCYSGDVLRSEPETLGVRTQCVAFSLDGSTTGTAARVDKAPDALRYKIELPPAELAELPALTLTVRDPQRHESLVSSRYQPNTPLRLGEVLTFSRERVTCKLEGGALVPRFGPLEPDRPLIEQLQ